MENLLFFILIYIICTSILFLIILLVSKFILKKKMFNISQIADEEITRYFDSYDDIFNKNFINGEENDRKS